MLAKINPGAGAETTGWRPSLRSAAAEKFAMTRIDVVRLRRKQLFESW